MGYDTTITFGSETLEIDSLDQQKVPGTIKQVVGEKLVLKSIPARTVKDFRLIIRGKHTGTDRNTAKDSLKAMDDNVSYALVDGEHDGDYFIESLVYNDLGNEPTKWFYTMILIQDQ